MSGKLIPSAALVLCLTVFSARGSAVNGIITEMTEPMYNSYEAQAVKWRGMIGRDEGNFYPAFCAAGVQHGKYVILFRFQPPGTTPVNFFGRHFSVVFDSRSNLVGMLRVKPEWSGMGGISHKRAETTSMLFIRAYVPALWRFAKTRPVETRDVDAARGSEAAIAGVLSLFYDDRRNTYFFVVVAPDGSVMAFERDLPEASAGFTGSEKHWLNDFYLRETLKARPDG